MSPEIIGPQLWAELHTTVTVETLSEWESRIPSYGCPCLDSYKKWKRERPPELEPDFFAWTVWLHNKVNYKLAKQPLSLEDATQIWRRHARCV